MKVIILAGGFGTRISDINKDIPKPMLPIGNRPIIWHIMNYYTKFGFNDFVIALGYKSEIIKEYFYNYYYKNSNFTVNLNSGEIDLIESTKINWKVSLIETGINSLTGKRLMKLKKYINNKRFFLTYGDGLSNINIKQLLNFHIKNKKFATLSAVRPTARFGELKISNNKVVKFEEKPQITDGWINGGFFVFEPEFFNYLSNKNEMLEREPILRALKDKQLMSFKHNGFWQPMDTRRDYDSLNKLWNNKKAPWDI